MYWLGCVALAISISWRSVIIFSCCIPSGASVLCRRCIKSFPLLLGQLIEAMFSAHVLLVFVGDAAV